MKKILLGLSLLSSISSFAIEMPTEAEMNKSFAKAEFATSLWFCDSEKTLKELADSMDIKNNLGCEKAIKKAMSSLDVSDIAGVLNQHIVQVKQLQAFEAEVKSGKGYDQLVPSVRALKANGLSLNLVKRNTDLTDEEILVVELSFERSKSELEIALERL
jgi:hypothetical protein